MHRRNMPWSIGLQPHGYVEPVISDRCTLDEWTAEVEALCKEMGL